MQAADWMRPVCSRLIKDDAPSLLREIFAPPNTNSRNRIGTTLLISTVKANLCP
jgi:hypothetical protein